MPCVSSPPRKARRCRALSPLRDLPVTGASYPFSYSQLTYAASVVGSHLAAHPQRGLDLVDQGFQPFGGAGPLRLGGGELVGALADLQDGGVRLVGGGFLLLGGEQGFLQ